MKCTKQAEMRGNSMKNKQGNKRIEMLIDGHNIAGSSIRRTMPPIKRLDDLTELGNRCV
jgi:hypothetical protein